MKSPIVISSALAAAVMLASAVSAQAGPAAVPGYENEKCFGIAFSGKNDCQTANSSCAGTSKMDQQADAWIYVPAGTCDKIVGGGLTPKA